MKIDRIGSYLIKIIILTIPLEISKTWFPILLLDKPVDGVPVSLIEISRLAMLALVALLLVQVLAKRHRLTRLGIQRLKLPLLLLVLYCISWGYSSAPDVARNEILRLAFHICVVLAMINFVRNLDQVLQLLNMFRWTTLILSVIVIFQAATGVFFWNLALTGHQRYNATMADPNLLARYLVIGFFVWLLGEPSKFRLPAILACLIAVLLSQSRGAWLTFALMSGVLVMFAPVRTRIRTIILLGVSGGAAVLTLMLSPTLQDRLATLSSIVGAAGARVDYVRAGLAMFIDRPFWGVGLGGYPVSYVTHYRQYLSYYGEAGNQSHTALITIAAELGIIGLVITFLFILQAFRIYVSSRVWGNPAAHRAALVCFVAIVTIFVASQTESRLWEDPYVWVFWSLLVSTEVTQQIHVLTPSETSPDTGRLYRRQLSGLKT